MKQYSFFSVDLIIDGVIIEGFTEKADIITVERSMDQTTKVMDARGKMIAVTSVDKSGSFSFDLLQTSDSNKYLQDKALLDQAVGGDGGSSLFVPIQASLVDRMGADVAVGVSGFITKQPGLVRGNSIVTNTWMIMFEQVNMNRERSIPIQ